MDLSTDIDGFLDNCGIFGVGNLEVYFRLRLLVLSATYIPKGKTNRVRGCVIPWTIWPSFYSS